jgi:hypothetical protein
LLAATGENVYSGDCPRRVFLLDNAESRIIILHVWNTVQGYDNVAPQRMNVVGNFSILYKNACKGSNLHVLL